MGKILDIFEDLAESDTEEVEKIAISDENKIEEIDLWKRWSKSKDQEALGELFDRYQPMFTVHHKKMESYGLPDSVQKAELGKWFIHSLNTFDPERDVALGTHVWSWLRKAKRLNHQYANVAYVPEEAQRKIGTFNSVKSNMEDTLDREPTAAELADELKWGVNEIARMEMIVNQKEIPETNITVAPWNQNSDLQDNLYYLYLELDPIEKLVMEHTIGYGGKQFMSAEQIAKKTKKSVSEINSIKNKIQTRLRQFHNG